MKKGTSEWLYWIKTYIVVTKAKCDYDQEANITHKQPQG